MGNFSNKPKENENENEKQIDKINQTNFKNYLKKIIDNFNDIYKNEFKLSIYYGDILEIRQFMIGYQTDHEPIISFEIKKDYHKSKVFSTILEDITDVNEVYNITNKLFKKCCDYTDNLINNNLKIIEYNWDQKVPKEETPQGN